MPQEAPSSPVHGGPEKAGATRTQAGPSTYLRLMRPYQWLKNGLLFLPLILAHEWMRGDLAVRVLLAAILFSLASSAVYVFNDFVDIERDRAHPQKCQRPLASGAIPRWHAPLLSAVLLAAALGLSLLTLPGTFTGLLAVYLLANVLYSCWLKHEAGLDVILLTLMYCLRILAGGLAVHVPVSNWMLTFSLFFFASLAFAKRYQELDMVAQRDGRDVQVRGYIWADLALLRIGGMGSGLLSILVLALYITGPEVTRLYSFPGLLWLLCPLAFYWVVRVWMMTLRGRMHHDPVLFALRDPASYIVGVLSFGVLLAAHLLPSSLG